MNNKLYESLKLLQLVSEFTPNGDQPKAIKSLVEGLNNGLDSQVLLGVTGSGKTFTLANVLHQINRPAIILSHNKTLAAQLYSELKSFFPQNNVEYFVSHFDYYRPEAYLPGKDVYIDKTSKTNWDLEAMRMSSLNSLLTSKDTIVVASVAAIYGALNPNEYRANIYLVKAKQKIKKRVLIHDLVNRNYSRNNIELKPGSFSVKGDVLRIVPAWTNQYYIKLDFFNNQIEKIAYLDILTSEQLKQVKQVLIYPADAYTTKKSTVDRAIPQIKIELAQRLKTFKKQQKFLEKQRLGNRVKQDLVQLAEFGICPGIENYALYMDWRNPGETPYTIFDYLPKNSIIIIDESHMMIPQVKGMYKADFSRKNTLVEYGFRLPSALDNRPLNFKEFEKLPFQKIYISATPNSYEIVKANNQVIQQIIRPTGLLDPIIEIEPKTNQIENMYDRIKGQIVKKQRTLVLTTTIRMAEELAKHFLEKKIKSAYIHNQLKTFERTEILRKLRKGIYDVVVGINLLREGIDLPEVSLILICDADIESFMRTDKSLIQIIGRASRHLEGRVVFYAQNMSRSMQIAIIETQRRRQFQQKYNLQHKIIPKTIIKPINQPINAQEFDVLVKNYQQKKLKSQIEVIKELRTKMLQASKELDFEKAIQLRDLILELQG